MTDNQPLGCWQNDKKLEGWIECLNQLLFLVEVEKLGLTERVVKIGDKTFNHHQRLNWLTAFNNQLELLVNQNPEVRNLITPSSLEQPLKPHQIKQLSENIETLLQQTYAYGAIWGSLENTFSLESLLITLSQGVSRVEVSTIDEVVEAYKEALENQLNKTDKIIPSDQPLILPPLKRPSSEEKTKPQPTATEEKTAEVKLPPPPTVSELKQLEELKTDLYTTAYKFFENNQKLPSNPKAQQQIKDKLDKLIANSIITTVDSSVWWGQSNLDADTIASQVSDKLISDLLLKKLRQVTDQSWLQLRASLRKHPLDLQQNLHQQLLGIITKRKDALQAINKLATYGRQAPVSHQELNQLAQDVIFRQLSLVLPNADQHQEEIRQLATKGANYVTYLQPLADTVNITQSPLNEVIQTPFAPEHQEEVKEIITTTGALFQPHTQHLWAYPQDSIKKYLYGAILRNPHNQKLIIEKGIPPGAILDYFTYPPSQAKADLEWLKQGAPLKVLGKTITSRPPLVEGDPLYRRLTESIQWQETHQEAFQDLQLPFMAKTYLDYLRLKNKLIGQPLLKISALLSLPSHQLNLGIEHLTSQLKEQKLVQEVINSRHWPVVNKIFSGVKAVNPFEIRAKARQKAQKWWQASPIGSRLHKTKEKFIKFVEKRNKFISWLLTPRRKLQELKGKIAKWWQKFKETRFGRLLTILGKAGIIFHPRRLLKKAAIWGLKKLGQLGIKILSKIGLDLAGLASGVGSLLAILALLKDLFSVFRRWWKEIIVFISGLLYVLINFLLSHLLALLGGIIGGIIGGPIGFALGFGAGLGLESLFGSVASVVSGATSLASSLWGTITGFATSTTGISLALTVIPGGTVLVVTSFFWYPYLLSTFLKSNLYYQSGGTPYLTLYKNLRLDNLNQKYILQDNQNVFPHLTNLAAKDKVKLTFHVSMKAVDKDLTIVSVKDTTQVYTKDSANNGGKLSKTIIQDLTSKFPSLSKGEEKRISYQLQLQPNFKNSRLINTLEVEVKDKKGKEYHKVTSFVTLIGDAPNVGCQQIAETADRLVDELYRCSDNQINDCYCPQEAYPQLGYFVNSYHCGVFALLANTIHPGPNWNDKEEHYIQCTEFVNYVYQQVYGPNLYQHCGGTLGNAGDWFENAPKTCPKLFTAIKNGGGVDPQVGDILVFKGTGAGHVGIVTQVGMNTLTFASANISSRRVTLSKTNGQWQSLLPGMALIGWLSNLRCAR